MSGLSAREQRLLAELVQPGTSWRRACAIDDELTRIGCPIGYALEPDRGGVLVEFGAEETGTRSAPLRGGRAMPARRSLADWPRDRKTGLPVPDAAFGSGG